MDMGMDMDMDAPTGGRCLSRQLSCRRAHCSRLQYGGTTVNTSRGVEIGKIYKCTKK